MSKPDEATLQCLQIEAVLAGQWAMLEYEYKHVVLVGPDGAREWWRHGRRYNEDGTLWVRSRHPGWIWEYPDARLLAARMLIKANGVAYDVES